MKKFWALTCTVAFSAFWVFGGLSILAWWDAHPLFPLVLGLSVAGLMIGVHARFRLVAVTQDLQRGQRVTQSQA